MVINIPYAGLVAAKVLLSFQIHAFAPGTPASTSGTSSWPTRCRLAKSVAAYPLPERPHGDIMPWNFILRGNGRLALIDGGESWATWPDAENLEKTVRLVKGESVETVLGMRP